MADAVPAGRVVLVLALAVVARAASALFIPGGGNPRSDCYVGFEVEGRGCYGLLLRRPNRVYGFVGDGGACTFRVRLCTDVAVPRCRPATVLRFPSNTADLPIPTVPASGRSCGSPATLTVPARGRGLKMRVVAVAKGRPRRDRDVLVLRCNRIGAAPFCGVVSPISSRRSCANLPSDQCPPNPAGGPNELDLTVAGSGTDLDLGWTGTFHNFAVPQGSTLRLCAIGCDLSTNPLCGVCGSTGAGSINGELFGPPVPLLSANVPLCVTNRFRPGEVISGTADIKSGDLNMAVDVLSDVFLTTAAQVCPRCNDGKCSGGPNDGKACVVESTVTVAEAVGDKVYSLSRDCPPSKETDQFGGSISLHLPLTSGKAACCGPRPCHAQPGDPSVGVPGEDDQCAGGNCDASCTGIACASTTLDGQCVDRRGGISQVCCSSDATKPCFPTAQDFDVAGTLERDGVAFSASAPWPDASYPKTGSGTLVSAFCAPATTFGIVNTMAGLPGPGAMILPSAVRWQTR